MHIPVCPDLWVWHISGKIILVDTRSSTRAVWTVITAKNYCKKSFLIHILKSSLVFCKNKFSCQQWKHFGLNCKTKYCALKTHNLKSKL